MVKVGDNAMFAGNLLKTSDGMWPILAGAVAMLWLELEEPLFLQIDPGRKR